MTYQRNILHNYPKRTQTRCITGYASIFSKNLKNKTQKFQKNFNRKSEKKFTKKSEKIEDILKPRLKDLDTLIELRGYNMDGYKEKYLFIYRSILNNIGEYTQEEVLDILYGINQKWENPCKEKDISRLTKSADRKQYIFSSRKIIEYLDISPEEQKSLKSIKLYEKTLQEKKEEKNAKRRKTGLTRAEWEKATRRQDRPWEKLGISRSSWERYAARDKRISGKARKVLTGFSGNLVFLYISTERFIFLYLGVMLQRFEQGLLNFNQEEWYSSCPNFYNPIPP